MDEQEQKLALANRNPQNFTAPQFYQTYIRNEMVPQFKYFCGVVSEKQAQLFDQEFRNDIVMTRGVRHFHRLVDGTWTFCIHFNIQLSIRSFESLFSGRFVDIHGLMWDSVKMLSTLPHLWRNN